MDLKYISAMVSYLLVCQTSEEIHPGPEHQRLKSVDEPDEENDPDSRMPGSAVRTVEVSQRNRCCTLIPVYSFQNEYLYNHLCTQDERFFLPLYKGCV